MRNANPLSLAEHPRRSRGVHPWMWMWAAYREITIFQCRRCTSSPQELANRRQRPQAKEDHTGGFEYGANMEDLEEWRRSPTARNSIRNWVRSGHIH
ncbi:uncharacterized protein Dsimw501_GD29176, isoform A [Drosophila simulans]|nr:uncharacterized protein Dsimw501_GD29176, isoform A [Drosophila simulans]